MRKLFPIVVLAGSAAARVSVAQSMPELFAKAKEQVKADSCKDALATLDALEAESQNPGNESVRGRVEAPLAFYRGVCRSRLGETDAAVAEFRTFLKSQPNASIDATLYGNRTAAAFEEARKDLADRALSLLEAYESFRPRPDAVAEPVDERWADGPVRYILTDAQKSEWAGLNDLGARTEFVERFWSGLSPAQGPDGSRYRQEFERRVAFADAHFTPSTGRRGSLTDRGMVFVLLGPPSYAGRKPLRVGDDVTVDSGTSVFGSQDAKNVQKSANASRGTLSKVIAETAKLGGSTSRAPESNANRVETWHYRREALPKGVLFQQVDFEFVTKKGYGENVLQRDANVVNTLGAAKR